MIDVDEQSVLNESIESEFDDKIFEKSFLKFTSKDEKENSEARERKRKISSKNKITNKKKSNRWEIEQK